MPKKRLCKITKKFLVNGKIKIRTKEYLIACFYLQKNRKCRKTEQPCIYTQNLPGDFPPEDFTLCPHYTDPPELKPLCDISHIKSDISYIKRRKNNSGKNLDFIQRHPGAKIVKTPESSLSKGTITQTSKKKGKKTKQTSINNIVYVRNIPKKNNSVELKKGNKTKHKAVQHNCIICGNPAFLDTQFCLKCKDLYKKW